LCRVTPVKPNLKLLVMAADRFPPFRVDVSVLFAKEIVRLGHTIDWLLQSDISLSHAHKTHWLGSVVYLGPCSAGASLRHRLQDHLYGFLHDLKIFLILRSSKYDFIVVKDKFVSSLLAILASRIFRTPFVYWLSYPFPEDYLFRAKTPSIIRSSVSLIKGHLFGILLYQVILPLSDHVFVQTERMKRNIAKHGVSESKMSPVPMAVCVKDVPFFHNGSTGNSSQEHKTVVYIGTLVGVRGMDFLIRTFKRVLDQEKDTTLYLVGDSKNPSDIEAIVREAKNLEIDHAIKLTGFLPQAQAWRYVQRADVCVSPIRPIPILECGSPTKLLEYMACGKAVVANDHPEQLSVISESKAGICVPYDEDRFADAIVFLLRNPDVAREMGARGRSYIEQNRNYEFTAQLVEKQLIKLFLETKHARRSLTKYSVS
jgi:glycosyltransferase involved in cell wall biosynthesis